MYMKETLSSNCLFHFTNSAENLLNILENEFSPRYCLEDLTMLNYSSKLGNYLEMAIPMVCFCDIPLSRIKTHISYYGNYGIGMTKSWGIKNGICPINYADKNSSSSKYMQGLLEFMAATVNNKGMEKAQINLAYLIRFVKPYIGDFWRSSGTIKNHHFYDEREWRYVPESDLLGLPFKLSKNQFLNSIERTEANTNMSNKCKINFEPDDIKYIIIEKEDQITSMINAIERIKNKYDSTTMKKLTTRIISKQNIIEDF